MRQIFSGLKQAFRKSILSVALVSLLSFSGLLIFPGQSIAAAPTERQPTLQKGIDSSTSKSPVDREPSYEELVEAVNDPNGLDKEYKENLEAFKETQPNKGLVEGAKELVEKVTGQE